jgi:uncharacterized protein YbdZ (MbtH family)
MTDETEDENYEGWLVVLNHEEQYSIWDEYEPIPKGWRKEGFRGAIFDSVRTQPPTHTHSLALAHTHRQEERLSRSHRKSVD